MRKTTIINNVAPLDLTARQVSVAFKQLLKEGYQLELKGQAKFQDPSYLIRTRPPKYIIDLFGVRFFLTDIRREAGFRFFVAYLVMPATAKQAKRIYPRIFYKDSSLIWRSASHLIKTGNEHWIGKGDLKPVIENGIEVFYSAEETTNLPFEIDTALDEISRRAPSVKVDKKAIEMVLRNAPEDRTMPYADFTNPRLAAMSRSECAIYNNQQVAWFTRANDPGSLKFATGFEPDLKQGLIDSSQTYSKLYGGKINKYRIASINRQIQYLFIMGPKQVWIIPPQPLDNLLTSYGVRAVESDAAEELCLPGFEFHYLEFDEDPGSLYSQIPKGFVGHASEIDPDRSDASPWIEKMPVIKNFRKAIKGGKPEKLALKDPTV